MASDWDLVSINNLAERVSVGHVGPTSEFFCESDEGVPLVRSQNVRPGKLTLTDVKYITYDFHEKLKKSNIKGGDILVVRVGQNRGDCCIVPYDIGELNCANVVLIKPNRIIPKFLELFLRSPMGQHKLLSISTGSAQEVLNTKSIAELLIPVPPLSEQKAIAHILGSLDDKIELNRQMNETLEAMAQALFKSWFVDFDPVIDNALAAGNAIPDEFAKRAEQRKTIEKKNNSDIHGLFPDEFEFTEEMGWIPKGWQELQIKDIAKVVKGKSYKSSELAESQTALVTLKSFKRGGGYRLDGLKEYTGKYKEEQEVKAGDLVIAYTDVTQAADLIGKPAMVIDDIRYKHLVISLDVAVVRPEIDSQKYYLYGLAQTEAFQSHNYSHSTGTTVLHLSKNAVPDYYLCLPSENLLRGFTKIVEPLFTSVNNNIGEIRNLEKLRDTLLPKLMSGELRITDATSMLEDA